MTEPIEPTEADVPLIPIDECAPRQSCGCRIGSGHTCDPRF